ncbi:hypothetical protein Tco_0809779 [Tanacetum coccineum]
MLMANMDLCDKHNMVAFLQKPSGSEEFHQIVDFLTGSHIRFLDEHNAEYVAPSLTQKLFSNMKIRFSRVHVPLFDSMLLRDQPSQGEGPTLSIESQHTPTASSPSTSQPTTSQPTSSQAQSSHEPTTEPITTTSSPYPQALQIP